MAKNLEVLVGVGVQDELCAWCTKCIGAVATGQTHAVFRPAHDARCVLNCRFIEHQGFGKKGLDGASFEDLNDARRHLLRAHLRL